MATTTRPGLKVYKDDEKKAALYNHRLAVADADAQKWHDKAKDWYDRYENVPKITQAAAKGRTVNVTTGISVIDALFSGLTAIDVDFILDAQAKTEPKVALLAEGALNQEWDICDVDIERDAAVKDALIVGIGFVKVGYDFYSEENLVDRDEEAVRADVLDLIAEAKAAGSNIDPQTIGKLVPDQETVTEVMRDRVVTDYVAWDKIRWDPKARQWGDVRWVAQYTKMSVEEVQQNPLWREYIKRNRKDGGLRRLERLKPDSAMEKDLIITGKPENDDQFVTIVEYWDFETGTFCVMPKGQNLILFEGVNPFALAYDFEDRNPFVPLVLRGTTRRIRGIGDMEVMLRSLNEKNLYRSRTATYIDRFVPKLVGEEDALTDEGKKALSSTEYGEYVSVAKGTDPKSLTPLTPPSLPSEVFGMNDRIDNEIREATGVNELMRGLFPDRKRTATETNEVVTASAARQSEKRNTLERFHVNIAKRILLLMQKFYDQPRMASLVDPTLGKVPWEWTGADLVGDFSIGVHLSPRQAHDRDSMRQEATVALNVLAPFAEPGQNGEGAVIDKATLVGWFMKKYGFSSRDMNELIQSPEEQQAQQAGQMQAQAGGPPPGPMSPAELLAATNGAQQIGSAVGAGVPNEVQAAAQGIGPGAPEAAGQVSRSAGSR